MWVYYSIELKILSKKQLPPDIAFVVIFMQVADPAWQTIIVMVQTS